MKILLLSPYPKRLEHCWTKDDDVTWDEVPWESWKEYDWVVSYGYRHIIKKHMLDVHPGHIINIHISQLPWNRGADPNFWSWFDDTPKGVTIHQMDEGIDTGPCYAVAALGPPWACGGSHTLASTYEALQDTAVSLFKTYWPVIRDGKLPAVPQPPGGSYHSKADAKPWLAKLSNGWNTPVEEVREMGRWKDDYVDNDIAQPWKP